MARPAFYAGKTAPQEHGSRSWAHRITIEMELRQIPEDRQTVDHQPAGPDAWALSITATESDPCLRRDEGIVSCGAWAETAARLVVEPADGWNVAALRRLAMVAEQWHLNDLRAASREQAAWMAEHPAPEDLAHAGYRPGDLIGWRLANVPTDSSGYRYGSAWLAEPLPAELLQMLRHIIDTGKAPAYWTT